MLGCENGTNPFEEVSIRIAERKKLACIDCDLSDEIADKASELIRRYSDAE